MFTLFIASWREGFKKRITILVQRVLNWAIHCWCWGPKSWMVGTATFPHPDFTSLWRFIEPKTFFLVCYRLHSGRYGMAPVNLGKVGGNQWLHALDHIRSIHISPVPCGGQRWRQWEWLVGRVLAKHSLKPQDGMLWYRYCMPSCLASMRSPYCPKTICLHRGCWKCIESEITMSDFF